MGITTTVRQAKLKPECADRYPTLPARMWTPAARLTELVASYGRAPPERPGKTEKGRTLLETDFEFRGGVRRRLGGLFARTRTGELKHYPWGLGGRTPEMRRDLPTSDSP